MRSGYLIRAFSLAVVLLGLAPPTAMAAGPASSTTTAEADPIGLFDGQAAGRLEIKVIPHDETTGTVMLTNKTAGPLTIRLPTCFGAVPVLAQFGAAGRGAGAGRNAAAGAGNQALGGGFGGPGLAGGRFGGGAVFSIAPDRVVKLKFTSVCLEHGKPEPNSRIAYELVPLDSYTGDAEVIELVNMLGRGDIDQPAAQCAAWRLANGLSWQELADKVGIRHISGATEPFFTPAQLQRAIAAVRRVKEEVDRAAGRQSGSSGGNSVALSSRP
jgi:hypothetical protein